MPIPRERIVPLIIAVALFMENMDSTVIATALPAIARDIGANPLALKLAITSYLLSLAIFIPASGWTADRFGARTRVPRRHRRVHDRLDRLRAVGLAHRLRHRAHRAGHGRRHDDPGRPHGAGAQRAQAGSGQRHGLGDGAGDDRAGAGAAGRRFHHHLFHLALDLHHQPADRPARHRDGQPLYRGLPRRDARALRPCRHGALRRRHRRGRLRPVGAGARLPALDHGGGADRRRLDPHRRLRVCMPGAPPRR